MKPIPSGILCALIALAGCGQTTDDPADYDSVTTEPVPDIEVENTVHPDPLDDPIDESADEEIDVVVRRLEYAEPESLTIETTDQPASTDDQINPTTDATATASAAAAGSSPDASQDDVSQDDVAEQPIDSLPDKLRKSDEGQSVNDGQQDQSQGSSSEQQQKTSDSSDQDSQPDQPKDVSEQPVSEMPGDSQ